MIEPQKKVSNRSLFRCWCVLFETPYQSSKATMDEIKIMLPAWIAFWNRARTDSGFPLMTAIQAFVSSRKFTQRSRG